MAAQAVSSVRTAARAGERYTASFYHDYRVVGGGPFRLAISA